MRNIGKHYAVRIYLSRRSFPRRPITYA